MKKNMGGRPPKKSSEKRKYQLCLKLNTEEEYTLKALCREASMPKQEYIRTAMMSSTVIQRITPEVSGILRKLCGLANNLNQIAKKANQAGYKAIRPEYLFLAERIDILINQLRYDSQNITLK